MNYNLALVENEDYLKIELRKIIFDQQSIFELEYLDKLTMNFKNEIELKQYLLEKGLINQADIDKKLCISYGDKHKREISIIYKEDIVTIERIRKMANEIKKYFNIKKSNAHSTFSYGLIMGDYLNITSYFESFEVFAGNHKFLRKLQDYVSNNPKQNVNINDISIYINQFAGDKRSKVIYIALYEIFRRLFYKFNKDTKDLEFNYKGFRDFCIFYCDYKRKSIKTPVEEEINELNGGRGVLSSDGDPDFPFNSEEEKLYNSYKERLEELADQNIDPYDEFYGSKRR